MSRQHRASSFTVRLLRSLASIAVCGGAPAIGQLSSSATWRGPAESFQSPLDLSPNLQVNLATGNLHVNVLTSRFNGTGRTPRHQLFLYHDSLGAPEFGDQSGGLGLGNGWSSSLGGHLEFPTSSTAQLTLPAGTRRVLDRVSSTLWRSEIDRELEVATTSYGWVATDADQWTRHYDSTGALFEIRDPSCNAYDIVRQNGVVASVSEPSGRYANFQISTAGHLTSVDDCLSGSWSFTYDTQGRLAAVVDPLYGSLAFVYDARDRISAFTDWSGATWQFTYFDTTAARDRVATAVDPYGHTRTFTYSTGTEACTHMIDLTGRAWDVYHDLGGPPALKRIVNPLAQAWLYQYDSRRHIQQITSPLGRVWGYVHDDAGNLLSLTDPLGQVRTWTYDALDNPTSTTRGGQTLTWNYDDALHPTSITSCVEPTAQASSPTTTYAWFGPLDGVPAGAWNGCLASVTDASGAVTHFEYDSNGTNIAVVEGPASAQGRVEKRWDTPTHPYFVDHGVMPPAAGAPDVPLLPASIGGRLGILGDGTRTALGLTAAQTWQFAVPLGPGAPESSTVTRTLTQDAFGRAKSLITVTDEPFERVPLPQPAPVMFKFTATHDDTSLDQPSVLHVPGGGPDVTLLRGAVGNLTSVTASQGAAVLLDNKLTYDDDGRLIKVVRLDGSSTEWTCRADDLIDTITHRNGTAAELTLDYDYDARGFVSSRTATSAAHTVVTAWSYDPEGRLVEEQQTVDGVADAKELFTYDAAGNRRSRARFVGAQFQYTDTYAYDFDAPLVHGTHNNRLVSIVRRGPGRVLISTTYLRYENPFGHVSHLVRKLAGSGAITATRLEYADDGSPWLAWDEAWDESANGPINVVRSNAIETRQVQGAARMWRQLDTATFLPANDTEWRIEFGPISADYHVSTADGAKTWIGLDVAGNRIEPASTSHALGDLVGTARLVESAGTFTPQEFTAWGERTTSPTTLPNRGYCGVLGARQALAGAPLTSSGLVAMGHRWYAPEIGRFLMRDPIGAHGGVNVYTYAGNQPTFRADPTGLAPHGGEYRGPVDPPRPGRRRTAPGGVVLTGPVTPDPPFVGPPSPPFVGPPAPPPPPNPPSETTPVDDPYGPPLPKPGDPDFVGPVLPVPGDPDFVGPILLPEA